MIGEMVQTVLILIRVGFSGRLLWTQEWIFVFLERLVQLSSCATVSFSKITYLQIECITKISRVGLLFITKEPYGVTWLHVTGNICRIKRSADVCVLVMNSSLRQFRYNTTYVASSLNWKRYEIKLEKLSKIRGLLWNHQSFMRYKSVIDTTK
jgi:hypothetical protein